MQLLIFFFKHQVYSADNTLILFTAFVKRDSISTGIESVEGLRRHDAAPLAEVFLTISFGVMTTKLTKTKTYSIQYNNT